MSKGGGGGYDTSGMEQATAQATALQREIYEQTREDVQPWYQAGVGGINKLSDLLGISGGSVQNRQGIYDELLPQYTTSSTSGGDSEMYRTADGRVLDRTQAIESMSPTGGTGRFQQMADEDLLGVFQGAGITPFSSATTADTTDFDALNTAVDERFGAQGTPEGYGSLLQQFGMDQFQEDPGAQYRRDQAQQALERSMAAQGVTMGGGGYGSINPQVARALEEQSQGIASQEYGQAFDRYNIGQQNVYNRLMGVAGMGQGSTGQMAAGGQNYATNVGNLQTGLAGAQANMAAAQASQPSMFSQLLGGGAQLAGSTYGGGGWSFSDVRLKENIEYVGTRNGHKIYDFNYIGQEPRFRGVMADEVKEVLPQAVEEINGYLAVDYGQLGFEMEAI